MRKLTEMTVAGFRVFCNEQTVPLDANVVLVHGPNGCGKTSLLHGIELCLTGRVADLDAFPNSYPDCLRHCDTKGEAWVSLTYLEDDGRPKSGKVVLNAGEPPRPPGGLLSRLDLRHFQDRCYLSQSRLARLLEIYQAVDKEKKESPLATFVRELLNLELLENLTTGLQVVGDKRRIRRDVKAYATLEKDIQDLASRQEDLQSKLHAALQAVADVPGQQHSSTSDQESALAKLSDEELSSSLRRQLTDLSIIEQAEAVLSSLQEAGPSLSLSDLQKEIEERERIQETLATGLKDYLAEADEFLGRSSSVRTTFDSSVQFGEEWDSTLSLCERKISQLLAEVDVCIKWNESLIAARNRAEELDNEWTTLSQQVQAEQTPSRAFTETLSLLLEQVHDDTCPVCDRNFAELQQGSLGEHLRGKLTELERRESLVATVIALQSKREEQRRILSESEAKDGDYKLRQQQAEQGVTRGRSLVAKHHELSRTRETWITNDEKQRTAKADVIRLTKASEQRSQETVRLFAIAERPENSELVNETDPLMQARSLKELVSKRAELLQDAQNRRIASKQANDTVAVLKADIDACKAKRAKMDRAQKAIDRMVENAKTVARDAAEEKRRIIETVFSGTLNSFWRELFERLVVAETFHPHLPAPEITRGKLETRLSAGKDGQISFHDLAAVLSSGNLNTAALSLFLTLNIIEQPRHRVLMLDDPVQNMDDIHVVNLGTLLKAIVHQAERQLIVAVHDRALFDYLRIELGPTSADESLITIEMERDEAALSTVMRPERHTWQPDKVLFGSATA